MRRALIPASVISLAFTLTACGGGGTSGGPATIPAPPTSPPAPPPPPAKTAAEIETENSKAVLASKASYAHDRGYSGKGVTIAIIDTGIDTDSPEFMGRVASTSSAIQSRYAACAECPPQTTNYNVEDRDGHGTLVASIAAGSRNSTHMYGMAYDANIMAIKIVAPDFANLVNGVPQEGTSLNSSGIAPAIRHAAQNGAFVINFSANGTSSGSMAVEQNAAMDIVRQQNLLLVESVSNDPGDSFANGSFAQALVGADFENKNWFLFGIGLFGDLSPRAASGTPGLLADRTLSVVSHNVPATGLDGQPRTVTGNSFAAPAIAGAAALLKQYWPQLGGQEISKILLGTATDLGAPGVDQIYGVGVLNVENAFKAQAPTISTSSVKASSVDATSLVVSPAFGGGDGKATFSAAAGQAVAIDTYGRDYKVNMGVLARGVQASGISLASFAQENSGRFSRRSQDGLSRVDGYADAPEARAFGFSFGRSATVTGTVHSSIDTDEMITGSMLRSSGIATVGSEFTLFAKGGRVSFAKARSEFGRTSSATRRASIETPHGLTFGLALNKEVGSALGMTGSGSFNIEGASSMFTTAGWNGHVGDFDLSAEGLLGRTRVTTRNALIQLADPVLSSGFRFSATHGIFGGRALFGLTSPLKVERAQLRYEAPTSYDPETRSTIETVRLINLAPSARELNVEAGWSRAFGAARLSLGGAYGINTGNVRGQSSAAGWLRFNSGF
ncbi:S8 family serine peptidase [Sphingomonas sp. GCM10030256]|uniref:S8 family peptidase n=1 Tax=Sphingomonas sp. GCM10030256 TaxID=3273427 RepID=UPI0036089778